MGTKRKRAVDDEQKRAPPAEKTEEGEQTVSHNSHKTPSAPEITQIKQSTALFRSTTFHALLTSLVPTVLPKASTIPTLEKFLFDLYAHLTGLKAVEGDHPLRAAERLSSTPSDAGVKKKKKKEDKNAVTGISVPWTKPIPTEDVNWKVSFEPPSQEGIRLVGSWAGNAKSMCVKNRSGEWGVDLAAEMPSEMFQEKDFSNGRVFNKRAFFLATLASSFTSGDLFKNIEALYESPSHDPRRTCIRLRSRDPDHGPLPKHFYIRIIPVLPPNSPISLTRLAPTQSNLRIQSFSDPSTSSTPQVTHPPSPAYNSSLSLTTLPPTLLLTIHTYSTQIPSFNECLVLLRIWANQRGYCPSFSKEKGTWNVHGFEDIGGSLWALLIGVVIFGERSVVSKNGVSGKEKARPRMKVGKGLSSYQLFRAVLDLLASRDFVRSPCFMEGEATTPYALETWLEYEGPVLVEPSGRCNVLSTIPPGSLDLLRTDAQSTLFILNRPSNSSVDEDVFGEVFARDEREPLGRFDAYLEFDLSQIPASKLTFAELDAGSRRTYLLAKIERRIRDALGSRAIAVVLLTPHNPPQPISTPTSSPSTASEINRIGVGILFDTKEAYRLVDHGPPASETSAATSASETQEDDDPATKAFKDLWGPKAELRRFKDGRITISVVWEIPASTVGGMMVHNARERIPARIVTYILNHHFSIPSSEILERSSFDDVLVPTKGVERALGPIAPLYGLGWRGKIKAFDEVVKRLKSIADGEAEGSVPLGLVNVQPASSDLRYTSVFPSTPLIPSTSSDGKFAKWSPAVHRNARYIPASDIILQFEKSNKWPDDLPMVQKAKMALLEGMARGLFSSSEWTGRAEVVVDESLLELRGGWGGMDHVYLDIVSPEGYAFRAWVYHDREATLLSRIISPSPLPSLLTGEKPPIWVVAAAKEALEIHEKRYIHAPRHHAAMSALHHRIPAFSHTVRLVKRFFGSWQLLSSIEEEAVELLVAGWFINHASSAVSSTGTGGTEGGGEVGSGSRGFVGVMRWLASWDWRTGIQVPLYTTTSSDNQASLPETDTPDSPSNTINPGAINASWILRTELDIKGGMWTTSGPHVGVADHVKVIAQAFVDAVVEGRADDPKSVFLPSDTYDFTLKLKVEALPRYLQGLDVKEELLRKAGNYVNLLQEPVQDEPVRVDFDPAIMYLRDLQRVYGDTIQFFHDPYGGSIIGGIFNPALNVARPWKVLNGYSTRTADEGEERKKGKKGEIVLNVDGVLDEIVRMGEGLIEGAIKNI
ncbi:Nrap protein [Sistotremastrum niveocremeum HHB9708]|uniref:U3 small nucleolar RNA-associated protein 22 n=1 Tax=Sistotremastrum niveocremeum HHB9708 TaxID=1314777 RepID=A0A164PXU0_9AGAM|nr:Nrap protein [Sistotremastrum niveocremeum HHB9708]